MFTRLFHAPSVLCGAHPFDMFMHSHFLRIAYTTASLLLRYHDLHIPSRLCALILAHGRIKAAPVDRLPETDHGREFGGWFVAESSDLQDT